MGIFGLNIGIFIVFNFVMGVFFGGVIFLSDIIIDIIGIVFLWERVKSILDFFIEYNFNLVYFGKL